MAEWFEYELLAPRSYSKNLSEKRPKRMENRIKRKLVCTGWLLDISTSTTNARKKLLIDFRGKICSGKGGCKCGNCRVRQPQALRVTTFPDADYKTKDVCDEHGQTMSIKMSFLVKDTVPS